MKTTIDKAGRLVIPKRLRDRAGFQPGAELDVRFNEDGAVEIALPAPKGELVYENGLPYWSTGRKIAAGEIDRAIEQAREERLDAIVRSAWGTDEDRS